MNTNNHNNINKPSNMLNGQYIECKDNKKNIVIVGGGLVGSLAALHLGKKGYNVNLYEYREDIRTAKIVHGRSINLALSCRGRKALASVGLEAELLKHGIPMKGRMLHDIMGNTKFVAYDSNKNECIYSVGRKFLNEVLLTAAEKYPNIHLNFNQKLLSAKIDTRKLTFLNPITNENTQVTTDLIIGCDGAFSTIRKCMLQKPGFDFSQTYIEHGYLELCIPPKNDTYAMPHNYLHIWPRGKFMMIALPNQDKSWTVTLFMPFSNFEQIENSQILIEFFMKYFPDALPLIGEQRLVKDFFNTKPQHLVSVKCRPLNYGDKVLLMGDAAHAMVPFYGQGMNAGFEDCSILSDILSKCDNDFTESLETFTKLRWEDAHSICDLAMYNYIEMRDLVTRKSFRARKTLDEFLYWIIPKKWIPLYNSVTFSNMSYRKCIENRKWQDKILSRTLMISMFSILGLFTIGYNFKYTNYLYDLLINKQILA